MKKLNLIILTLLTTIVSYAQEREILISESFSPYSVGSKIAVAAYNAGNYWWTTWNNAPGGSEDGVVATYSGNKCGHLTFGNDQVLLLGDKETGNYDLEFDILVPQGKNGYFNILHHFAGANSTWAMQCYLHMTNDGQNSTPAPGHGTIHAGSNSTADVPCVYDAWMHFRLNVNTDTDIARYYYTSPGYNEVLLCTWQWSLDSFGENTIGRTLSAMDFFPPDSNDSEFYIDNIIFIRNYYTITATANPTNGGTVTGGGTYQQGQQCTVSATPASNFTFLKWTENGTQVSTNPNYTFTVTGNRTLVAQFQAQPQNYNISVSANPTNGGTVSGGGTYAQGSTCTLHATANSGYSFVKWTKNGTQVSTNPTYSFTVTGNAAYVAHFEQSTTYYTVSATANPAGSGFVEGQGTYAQGSTCTLSATPNGNYSFEKWVKDGTQVSTNPSYSFTVTSNANCTAYFVPTYTITATTNPSNGGTVTGGGTYQQGQQCTVSATPASNFTFLRWTENGAQVSTDADYTFTVTGNRTLVAEFNEIIPEYTITVNADPTNGGEVSGGGIYPLGATCVLTASPNLDFVFENWTRNDIVVSTSPSFDFEVTRDAEYVAHFIQDANHCTITAIADPFEGGAVSGSGTYELGIQCVLNAFPAVGFEFVNWTTQDGNQVSTNTQFGFTVTCNAVYIAHFRRIVSHYTITASVEPAGAGSVIGAATFDEGDSCTLIAMPNPTYSFVSWTENGIVVSTDDHYTFTVDRDRNLVAVFSQGLFYTISASAGANGTISPEGDVFVEPGEDKTFAMIPNSGCSVQKVVVDGVDVGPVESYTFRSVNSDHTIHVQFSGLGVDDNTTLDLKVYPNPAKESLIVEGENMKRIAVFNLLGVQMASQEVNDSHTTLNIDGLTKGTYILKVEYADGTVGYMRFVAAD